MSIVIPTDDENYELIRLPAVELQLCAYLFGWSLFQDSEEITDTSYEQAASFHWDEAKKVKVVKSLGSLFACLCREFDFYEMRGSWIPRTEWKTSKWVKKILKSTF